MMNRLFTFFFVLLLSSWNAYGQVPPESPAGVGVVSPIVPGSEAVPSWAMNATFKYGILDALSGKIGFYVQADVTPIACLELGLGITRKNILFEAATGSGENNGYFLSTFNSPYWQGVNRKDLEEFFYDYDFRTVKTGSYISLMPRVNFTSGASIMSSFIGCRFEYRRYNWKADGVLPTNELIYNPNVQFNEMERQLNLVFIYGGYYKMGNLSLEFYAGAGTRYYTMKKRDIGIEYKGATQVPEYGAVLSTFKKTSAMVEAGINIGISTATK
jgi:hypothetical protein